MNKIIINIYVNKIVNAIKNDRLTEEQILELFAIYKEHELNEAEIKRAKEIRKQIKNGKITNEYISERLQNYLQTHTVPLNKLLKFLSSI